MIQVICRTCHGTGQCWSYTGDTSEMVTCFSCNGRGKLDRVEKDVLKDQVEALTEERDRAIAILNTVLSEIILKEVEIWNRGFGDMCDLKMDIYEREHPDVEVPW